MGRINAPKIVQFPLPDRRLFLVLRARAARENKSIATWCSEKFAPLLLRELGAELAEMVPEREAAV